MPLLCRQVVKDSVLLVLGALLYTLASPPYAWVWPAWFALTPLYLALYGKPFKTAFFYGFLYGALFCAGITSWAYAAVTAYFSLSFPFNLFCTLLIYVIFVCPYTGLIAALSCVLLRRGHPAGCWVGIPALWVVGEFARSSFFAGFSWELLGHTQYRLLPLIQLADLTGVYGISFLLALSGYVAATVMLYWREGKNAPAPRRQFPGPALAGLAGAVLLVWGYGVIRLHALASAPSLPPLTLAVVQGQIPQAQRWQRVRYAATLAKYAAVTRRGLTATSPDLLVWPEFALGFYPDKEPLLRLHLQRLTRRLQAPLLFGAPRLEETHTGPHVYNSAYLFSPEGELVDVYDKIRLVPFAEYRPLRLPALRFRAEDSPSEFTAGTRSTVFALPPSSFGVLICYEATYPQLARRLVQGGAQFLVNISNDTWLAAGGVAATSQHFSMVIFRAVENRRPLARAATAGVSGFVDPTGRPYQLSQAQEGVVIGHLTPRHEQTLYTRYGDWFVIACTAFAAVALVRSGRNRTEEGE